MSLPRMEENISIRPGERAWHGSIKETIELWGADCAFGYISRSRDDILTWFEELEEEQQN